MLKDIFNLLITIANSNFIVASVTLVVGLLAFRIYKKQQTDAKRDAANVILLEIQSAERQLRTISQNRSELSEKLLLMKNSSWDMYRYLFVRDFDRDEWDRVTDFYDKCSLYDKSALAYNSTWADSVKSVQTELLAVLAQYAKDYVTSLEETTDPDARKKLRQQYEERRETFISVYGVVENKDNYSSPYFYNPQKPVLEAKEILTTLETNLSLSSVGAKLTLLSQNRKSFFKNMLYRIAVQ